MSPVQPPLTSEYRVAYAGFWIRFLAVFIDGLLITAVQAAIMFVFFGGFLIQRHGTQSLTVEHIDPGVAFSGMALSYFVWMAIVWLYYALMESSSTQGTLGKMACGLRVTDLSGNRISFARATGRHFGKLISAFILMAGFVVAAFTEKKQALHDLMASTIVLRKSSAVAPHVATNAFAGS